MYKLTRMKNRFKDIHEIKEFLRSKIFSFQDKESYIFGDDAYAILQGDYSVLVRRNNIVFEGINQTYRYSIFQYESTFIFRTVENEISPNQNEFIISVIRNQNETDTITFFSMEDKSVVLRLQSD